MSDENTLHLAITMAGAVSAGAYTAGVIDYLLEVLDEWERLKKEGDPRVPKHNIKLEILSGASAGGMTAAITAVALHYGKKQPIQAFSNGTSTAYDDCKDNAQELKIRKENNRLYNSWVNLTQPDMIEELLKRDDETKIILRDKEGKPVKGVVTSSISALNSNFITELAKKNLSVDTPDLSLALSPYVSDKFRLFVTLTNLDGYQKEFRFAGGGFNPSFLMYDHRDIAFFRFGSLEAGQRSDGSIQVDFKNKTNLEPFIAAGIATGAFPVGLAYRTFSREIQDLQDNVLLQEIHGDLNVKNMPRTPASKEQYRATFMDGGIINNEPFDLTDKLLRDFKKKSKDDSDHNKLNRLALLIDPFPSEVKLPTDYGDDLDLAPYNLSVMLAKLVGTLRTQVLVKTDLIQRALDEDDHSCFIMAPRRRKPLPVPDGKTKLKYVPIDGTKAIASGSLGGFGGFLDKNFREHDFYLGRINCKSFLQKHFCFPAGTKNKIFTDGYAAQEAKDEFTYVDPETKEKLLPIIPDVNKLRPGGDFDLDKLYGQLIFPRLDHDDFEDDFGRHESSLVKRVKFVIKSNAKLGWGMNLGLWWIGSSIYDAVYNSVAKGLEDWDILPKKKK